MKKKVKDLLLSTKDELVSTAIESETFSELIKTMGETVLSEGVSAILGEILGMIAPRINGIRLSYRQKRFERNIIQEIKVILDRIELLELKYESLDEKVQEKFRTIYLWWLSDNVYEEKQEKKISYNVNGYINLMSNESNDNLLLMFFNTINELTELDIDILRLYNYDSEDNIWDLCKRNNLEPEQTIVIKEKLVRLGLLLCKNDVQRKSNMDTTIKYLEELDKDNNKKKPHGVNFPKNKIRKINNSKSYSITNLGKNFLRIISAD